LNYVFEERSSPELCNIATVIKSAGFVGEAVVEAVRELFVIQLAGKQQPFAALLLHADGKDVAVQAGVVVRRITDSRKRQGDELILVATGKDGPALVALPGDVGDAVAAPVGEEIDIENPARLDLQSGPFQGLHGFPVQRIDGQ